MDTINIFPQINGVPILYFPAEGAGIPLRLVVDRGSTIADIIDDNPKISDAKNASFNTEEEYEILLPGQVAPFSPTTIIRDVFPDREDIFLNLNHIQMSWEGRHLTGGRRKILVQGKHKRRKSKGRKSKKRKSKKRKSKKRRSRKNKTRNKKGGSRDHAGAEPEPEPGPEPEPEPEPVICDKLEMRLKKTHADDGTLIGSTPPQIFQNDNCAMILTLNDGTIGVNLLIKKKEHKEYTKEDISKECEATYKEMNEGKMMMAAFITMLSTIEEINKIQPHPLKSKCVQHFLLCSLQNLKNEKGEKFPDETIIRLTAQQWLDFNEHGEDIKGDTFLKKGPDAPRPVLKLVSLYEKIGFRRATMEEAGIPGEGYYHKETGESVWIKDD
jgi:hypothetical protein